MSGPLRISYQGHLCSDGYMERKPGMAPDNGSVRIPTEIAKKLILRVQTSLFAPMGRLQSFQPMSIQDVDELPTTQDTGGGTLAGEAGEAKVGFDLAGQLIFEAEAPPQGEGKAAKTVLEGIYVHPNGIRSALEELDKQDDTKGEIQVMLTDIRIFWPRYGTLYGDINITRPGGGFDQRSVRLKGSRKSEPFNLEEIFRWAVHALPGAPELVSVPGDTRDEIPVDLMPRWERPAYFIQTLLDKYNMEIGLTTSNDVAIFRRGGRSFGGSPVHVPGQFPSGGLRISLPAGMLSVGPMVSQRWNDVPPIVTVVGGPIHQNVRARLTPVSLDTDGELYSLFEVIDRWEEAGRDRAALTRRGVAGGAAAARRLNLLELALQQSTNDSERAYVDLLRAFEPDTRILRRKIEIAQACWFKWFQLPSQVWLPPDKASNPALPMLDRAVRDDEKKRPRRAVDAIAEAVISHDEVGNEVAQTGKHRVRLEPPRLVAHRLSQRKISNPAVLIEIYEEAIQELEDFLVRLRNTRELDEFQILDSLEVRKAQYRSLKFNKEEYGATLIAFDVGPGRPFRLAAPRAILPGVTEKVIDWEIMKLDQKAFAEELKEARRIASEQSEESQTAEAALASYRAELRKVVNNEDATFRPNIEGWINEFGTVPDGKYSIHRELGLVVMADPAIITDRAYGRLSTTHNVQGVTYPEIIYGVEQQNGAPQDYVWANVVLQDGKAKVVSFMDEINHAPYVVNDPNLVLYVDRNRRAFNTQEIVDRAEDIAEPILKQPSGERGFRYVYDGFHAIDAIAEVSSVTWRSDGDAPFTEILVNDFQFGPRGVSVAEKRKRFTSDMAVQLAQSGRARPQAGAPRIPGLMGGAP
jgi:hypothetical protein